MIAYSQKDPAYRDVKLGKTKMTIGSHGCFVCAIATLYQVHPLDILKIPGAITDKGLVVSGVIAKALGGTVSIEDEAPEGWCVAVTDEYDEQGYPTHFFPYNAEGTKRVDPLDMPANIETNDYRITKYRVFTNIKFTGENVVAGPFADVPANHPQAKEIQKMKDKGLIGGFPDGTYRPEEFLKRGDFAVVLCRALNL